jgi:UDP-N-acetylmuramoyl-L-alanyl-D-glutamate--2,6-diaminopimelate ligase
MKLSTLLTDFLECGAAFDREVLGLSLDSRRVLPGFAFFAYAGSKRDGRDYIKEAIGCGATVIFTDGTCAPRLVDDVVFIGLADCQGQVSRMAATFYGKPAQDLTIIGVTGTNGKTSVVHLLAQCLHHLGQKVAMIGTVGVGIYPHFQSAQRTTPDPITLMKQLAQFAAEGASHVVMEVSSHSLAQARVAAIPFTCAVFTNLTRDHLDYHLTMVDYQQAKARLFSMPGLAYAIMNTDDPVGEAMWVPTATRMTYQLSELTETTLEASSSAFLYQQVSFKTTLLGQFNMSNVLAAIKVLQCLTYSLADIQQAIAQCHAIPGRMEWLAKDTKARCIIDYAHTPDALSKVLSCAKALCRGRLICVFGCGGDRDRGKRPLMAAAVEKYADQIYVTNDNPRTEAPLQIIKDIRAGFADSTITHEIEDRGQAIAEAMRVASASDIVLIAGKGHENYQEQQGVKTFFSDRDHVKQQWEMS